MKRLWLLNDLFVVNNHRGKGISVALIDKAKEHCKQTRACGLILETAKDNKVGNNLYIFGGWNGKKAVVTGFMIPVKMEKGLVTEFLLMRNTMACCYGAVPNMNEWVIVKMKKGVAPLMDVPVAFYGELKVGAMFENGYMTGLYELEGERMGEVQG